MDKSCPAVVLGEQQRDNGVPECFYSTVCGVCVCVRVIGLRSSVRYGDKWKTNNDPRF